MPRKNIVKTFVEDGYYHVYNRGVEKRTIFQDPEDYKIFLTQIKNYVTPPPDLTNLKHTFTLKSSTFQGLPHQNKNYDQEIKILCYALMPNHFHLLINQKSRNSITNFMRSLLTKYTMYFNKKYQRVGSLFQSTYKGILITQDYYLLHLSRYIHRNPIDLTPDLTKAYTSYPNYIHPHPDDWINTKQILSFFDQPTLQFMGKKITYQPFVENYRVG